MRPFRKTVFAASLALAALILVTGVHAQIGVTPYKVNDNWDKLEGRTIRVASGIRVDPDGQHLWILDRCGANGCAESTLDPIMQVDLDGTFVRSFGKTVQAALLAAAVSRGTQSTPRPPISLAPVQCLAGAVARIHS
jgi:hypothetical protein